MKGELTKLYRRTDRETDSQERFTTATYRARWE